MPFSPHCSFAPSAFRLCSLVALLSFLLYICPPSSRPFLLCARHFISGPPSPFSLDLAARREQMALIHNLLKSLTLMRKDTDRERERDGTKKIEIKRGDQMPRAQKHNSGRKHSSWEVWKTFFFYDNKTAIKKYKALGTAALQCALHRPGSILKTWQEAAACIYITPTLSRTTSQGIINFCNVA